MKLFERDVIIPLVDDHAGLLSRLREYVMQEVPNTQDAVRLAVTKTDVKGYHCELGLMEGCCSRNPRGIRNICALIGRQGERTDEFNAVLLVPTGIGARIGGHSGDAGPVARLLAANCDTLITHPNVVNAADINELPDNALYVEGSVITSLLTGHVGLRKVRSNRVLVVVDAHPNKMFTELAINSVSAARASFGLDCPKVVVMEDRVRMRSAYSKSGRAAGEIEGFEKLGAVLDEHVGNYDAVALTSLIDVPPEFHAAYFERGSDMVNPWGGVEAMLTHAVSLLYHVPSAHSPMMTSETVMNLDVGIVDPRKAAESVSTTYLHCILKGLHRSPQIVSRHTVRPCWGSTATITVQDISCLIVPDGCVGIPTLAALEQGIPVIAVCENDNLMENYLDALPFRDGKLFIVANYLEAVGVMTALRAGVAVETVRRPLKDTNVEVHRS